MQVVAAYLCDFASVREGMLTIVSGGITRMTRPQLPASIQAHLAVSVELDPVDMRLPHEIVVTIVGPGEQQVAEIRGGFQLDPNHSTAPGEPVYFHLPIDLRPLNVTNYGLHEIRLGVDGGATHVLPFQVVSVGPTPGGLPTPGPSSKKPH